MGSGRGGQLAVYRNDGKGGFKRWTQGPFEKLVTRDQTSVLGWSKAAGTTVILAGSANYEDGSTNGESVLRYDFQNGSLTGAQNFNAIHTLPMRLPLRFQTPLTVGPHKPR